jgi:uncharacterized protein (DUF1501 family)
MKELLHKMDEMSRRNFVSYAASTFLGVTAAPYLASSALAAPASSGSSGKQLNVIYLFMDGGMTHLDTFDPKPGTDVAGETQAIKTSVDGIQISGYLPKTAKHMNKMAIIRSISSKQGEHERAKYLMRTSYNPIATIRHPAMGAWLLKMQGKEGATLPGYVLVNGASNHPGAGYLDGRYAPLPIGDPNAGLQHSKPPAGVSDSQFQSRLQLADALDKSFRTKYRVKDVAAYTDFYRDAIKLMKSEDVKAFDLTQEKKETRDMYGTDRFGQGALLARRLVQHGVRFVEVNFGGWDMHYELWDKGPDHIGILDTVVSALLTDLERTGLLKNTLVCLGTDFGRTPKINDRGGRDHHPRVFSVMMAGAGIKNGLVYGKSDAKAYAPEENPVSVEDYNATIASAVGLPLDKQVFSPSGRPFTVANKGKAITALLA